jgi:hypothetical protein
MGIPVSLERIWKQQPVHPRPETRVPLRIMRHATRNAVQKLSTHEMGARDLSILPPDTKQGLSRDFYYGCKTAVKPSSTQNCKQERVGAPLPERQAIRWVVARG